MTDPTNTDMSTTIPAAVSGIGTERTSETSPEDVAAFFESQKDESARIKKMYRFYRKSDYLDCAIADVIESFLDIPSEIENN